MAGIKFELATLRLPGKNPTTPLYCHTVKNISKLSSNFLPSATTISICPVISVALIIIQTIIKVFVILIFVSICWEIPVSLPAPIYKVLKASKLTTIEALLSSEQNIDPVGSTRPLIDTMWMLSKESAISNTYFLFDHFNWLRAEFRHATDS